MNVSKLAFHGFIVDYTHMGDGFILIHKPNASITDADLTLIRATVNVPGYMVWKSDYQTVTVG